MNLTSLDQHQHVDVDQTMLNLSCSTKKSKWDKNNLWELPLGVIKEEKDLGVIVCQNLKVGKQCFKAASKGNQVLRMI